MVHCKRALAADVGLLMGEVPDLVAPVLQVDVPQPGARLDDQLDRAAVQAAAVGLDAGRFATAASPRRLLRGSPASCSRSTPPSVSADSECSGSSIGTPCGTYSSVPPDQQAAFSAENLSLNGIDDCRSKNGRSRSPCSATSRSRLPNSTPLLRPLRIELAEHRAAVDASPSGRRARRPPPTARAETSRALVRRRIGQRRTGPA